LDLTVGSIHQGNAAVQQAAGVISESHNYTQFNMLCIEGNAGESSG
jgi:hypothetical protein